MRAFVRLRRLAISHADLAQRLDELEARYDVQLKAVFEAIRKLMEPPVPAPGTRRIGFLMRAPLGSHLKLPPSEVVTNCDQRVRHPDGVPVVES